MNCKAERGKGRGRSRQRRRKKEETEENTPYPSTLGEEERKVG